MNITVNGEALSLDGPVSVTEILAIAKAKQPQYVTVQRNGEFVRRDDFDTVKVEGGDTVEFLYFMGGGAYGFLKSEDHADRRTA